ncbi:hypothetical protein ACWDGI_12330 [Streptomyces sp. NPDC001220]
MGLTPHASRLTIRRPASGVRTGDLPDAKRELGCALPGAALSAKGQAGPAPGSSSSTTPGLRSPTAARPAAAGPSGRPGGGGGMGGPGGTPTQQHIHTIIRTPNGGDYGVDLLKLHLETDH